MAEYTPEELEAAGLGPEEMAALEAGKETADDLDALRAIAGEGEDDAPADTEAKPADPVAEDTEDDAEEDAVPADKPEFTPQYHADPVADFDAQMAAIGDDKKALRQKLNEGDLSLDEYDAEKDALAERERVLREQQFKAQLAAEQNQQTAMQRWRWEQDNFFADAHNAIYKDDLLLSAFDHAVRKLGAEEANASKPHRWFLTEADRMVRERFSQPAAEKPVERTSRKPDLSVIPKTLGNLPAADIPSTGGEASEFAHIDRLTGLDLEDAVAAMSDTERERYRRAA